MSFACQHDPVSSLPHLSPAPSTLRHSHCSAVRMGVGFRDGRSADTRVPEHASCLRFMMRC
eukprot:2316207-Alexandrium_andersonii.AAC.1